MFQVGDELGRYEIIAHLKSGGMAALYLGRRRHPPDNRIFAIKVVHPHLLDDSQLVQMFLDEARLSCRIDHPNVVRVEEMGEDGGVHFLVMEYVHGCSLAQLLQALIRRGRRMQPELALFIGMGLAEGLHAAHETKDHAGEPLHVVHRDVSPQNVLLSHTGEVKLIDFGIAKSRARMHHSMTGLSIRGKLRYMSPEHARGKSVDRRTDVYALGIVIWEMLTMRPLFWADSDFEVLKKVQDPDVDPPSRYAPGISPEVDEAILRALARERDERPHTAMELRQLLSSAMPFAEALDSEHVAELLDAVLGEEIDRATDDIPAEASREMGITDLGRTRENRVARPVTQRAIDELTMELLDPSISVELFADDDPSSDAVTLDEGLDGHDEPTELMTREALQQIQSRAGIVLEVPPYRLQDFSETTDLDDATVVEHTAPTFIKTALRYEEEEPTTLKDEPGLLLPRPPPPTAAPEPAWTVEPEDDASAERMALLVGAAVAAILLAVVGFLMFY